MSVGGDDDDAGTLRELDAGIEQADQAVFHDAGNGERIAGLSGKMEFAGRCIGQGRNAEGVLSPKPRVVAQRLPWENVAVDPKPHRSFGHNPVGVGFPLFAYPG